MEICPRCGVENKTDRAACWNCFGPLESGVAEGEHLGPVARQARFSIRIPWKPILTVLVIGGAVFGGYRVVIGRSPGSVATAYMSAVAVDDKQTIQNLTVSGGTSGLFPGQIRLDKYQIQPEVSVQDTSAEVTVMISLTPDTGMISRGVNLAEHARTLADAMEALGSPISTSITLTKADGRWKVDEIATARRVKSDIIRKLPKDVLDKLAKIPQSSATVPGPAGAPGVPGAPAPVGGSSSVDEM